MTNQPKPHTTNAACACYCPRCRHQTRFQQAMSDKCWVCQKCLRVRLTNPDEAKPTTPPRV